MNNPTHNPVRWFEIYVSDMERALHFYRSVFQQPIEKMDEEAGEGEIYLFTQRNERYGICGTLVKHPKCSPGRGGTMVYFECEDCALEVGCTVIYGGRVLQDKKPIGKFGYMAIIEDSEGNVIGLHSML
jgi:predicted enzyme related to lactoylglutathione lyase